MHGSKRNTWNPRVRNIALGGLIAAVYAALTMGLAPISYGPWQLRVAEAMCILPIFTPAAVPGLFVGCLISNLLSQYGPWDVALGSLATLLAAMATYKLRARPFLALWPPVLSNALIIGGMIAAMSQTPFLVNMLSVGVGEMGACVVLGGGLYLGLRRALRGKRISV